VGAFRSVAAPSPVCNFLPTSLLCSVTALQAMDKGEAPIRRVFTLIERRVVLAVVAVFSLPERILVE
jgi:hypothetical protein